MEWPDGKWKVVEEGWNMLELGRVVVDAHWTLKEAIAYQPTFLERIVSMRSRILCGNTCFFFRLFYCFLIRNLVDYRVH